MARDDAPPVRTSAPGPVVARSRPLPRGHRLTKHGTHRRASKPRSKGAKALDALLLMGFLLLASLAAAGVPLGLDDAKQFMDNVVSNTADLVSGAPSENPDASTRTTRHGAASTAPPTANTDTADPAQNDEDQATNDPYIRREPSSSSADGATADDTTDATAAPPHPTVDPTTDDATIAAGDDDAPPTTTQQQTAAHSTRTAPASGPSADRTFTWQYDGQRWRLDTGIPTGLYDHYSSLERPVRLVTEGDVNYRQNAYDLHVSDPYDDAYLVSVADALRTLADDAGYDEAGLLGLTLAFIQGLPYTADNVTTSFDEYPRYPIETLFDAGGDCEDTSILYASLVQHHGHDAILLVTPRHMGTGVIADTASGLDPSGAGIHHDGHKYVYAETTGSGWDLGERPADVEPQMDPLDLAPAGLLLVDIGDAYLDGDHEVIEVAADQLGTGPAHVVVVEAYLHIVDEQGRLTYDNEGQPLHYDHERCVWDRLDVGDAITCTLRLDLSSVPKGTQTRISITVDDAEWRYANAGSSAWTPRP